MTIGHGDGDGGDDTDEHAMGADQDGLYDDDKDDDDKDDDKDGRSTPEPNGIMGKGEADVGANIGDQDAEKGNAGMVGGWMDMGVIGLDEVEGERREG